MTSAKERQGFPQDSTNLIINRSRTEVKRKFYSIRAARGPNALPTDTRNSETVAIFKRNLSSEN